MKWNGFTGSSYTPRSIIAQSERTCNWQVEAVESENREAQFSLYRTPGLTLFVNTGVNDSVRGMIELNGRAFAVVGGSLFEVNLNGTVTLRGAVANAPGRVSMALNPTQLMVVSGGHGYILTLATNAFAQITDVNFPDGSAAGCTFLVGYFIVFVADSQQFQISEVNNGLSWIGTDFSSAEASPDFIKQIAVSSQNLWVLGSQLTQVYSATGSTFPFQTNSTGAIDGGAAAGDSVSLMDGTLFWLSRDSNGPGIVVRARGLSPQRISDFAVEAAIESYPTAEDAEGLSFVMGGHLFYRLTFPSALNGRGATWQFDASNDRWTEVSYWNSIGGYEEKHRARCVVPAFGKILAGDWSNGKIYVMSMSAFSDDGVVIRRVRRAPHIREQRNLISYRRLWFNGNMGIGVADENALGHDPQMIVRWSFDGGRTYGNERMIPWGKIGKYGTIPQTFNLGFGRDLVVEAVVSDPVDWAITAAYFDAEAGGKMPFRIDPPPLTTPLIIDRSATGRDSSSIYSRNPIGQSRGDAQPEELTLIFDKNIPWSNWFQSLRLWFDEGGGLLLSGVFADRPSAAAVPENTRYVSTDLDYEESTVIAGAWVDLGVDEFWEEVTPGVPADGIQNVGGGPVNVLDDFNVAGDAHLFFTLEVDGGAFFDGNVDIDAQLDVQDAAIFRSTLEVDGVATFDAAVDMDSTLDVFGDGIFRAAFSVLGVATFSGIANFDGNVDMDADLDVLGAVLLRSTLEVDGVANFDGAVDIDSTLDVLGAATFRNTVEAMGFLQADDGFAAYDNSATTVGFAFTNQNATASSNAFLTIVSANEYLNSIYSKDASGNNGWVIGGVSSSNPFVLYTGNSNILTLSVDGSGNVTFPEIVYVGVSGNGIMLNETVGVVLDGGGDVVLETGAGVVLDSGYTYPTGMFFETDNSTYSASDFYGTSAADYDTLVFEVEGKVAAIGAAETALAVYIGSLGFRVIKGETDFVSKMYLYIDL